MRNPFALVSIRSSFVDYGLKHSTYDLPILTHLYAEPPHHPIPKGPHFDDLAEMFWSLETCLLTELTLGAAMALPASSEQAASEMSESGFMVVGA